MLTNLSSLLVQNRPFSTQEAADLLSESPGKISACLARYARQGHLIRVKPGVYLPVSERFLTPNQSLSDPWKVVPALFPEAYVGGWSAANFWSFTEQIFQDTCILSHRSVFKGSQIKHGFAYRVFQTHGLFGLEPTWRDHVKVEVSDPHRTVLDMLANPKCGGGGQHVVDCFKEYVHTHFNQEILAQYALAYTNGAFFKRLGFIAEKVLGSGHSICDLARKNISKGYAKIDADLPCPVLITRWNLKINQEIDL